ncbi:hypothetical protein MPTK1_1g03210 [Marchantia polymorpha subsp. ruderalis]|uniref:Zinc finger PHD-type domain-containing protein n=2 Tax=Marchantia polymorpha TaxID=3197 RepID=A0AAF6AL07_MARPO|nr:hypothetical protein MARPO_0005s0286 [Marchantia polymorpha]BBM97127.1 hypothetical protein Mp_1g03210 [Marchantia polymorpha subsp. ruderalis]|eukprot:PTQ48678.1 hypothetical protein MARPO_0005s0286 [Marchantia polymorpha]
MARVHGMAHAFWESVNWEIGDRPEWKLIFKQGWERNLRIGGYYAGHPKLSDLKEALNKQNVDTMSPGYGGGADGEESSSWKGPRGIEHHKRRGADEGDETPEPKRRKIIVAAMHQNNVDEDERTEMVYKQRAEKALRCGSPIQSKLASHLNHDHNSRALPGRRDRPLAALPSPREVFREKEVDFPRRSDASGRTSKVLSERTMTDDAADSFVLKCGDRLVSVTHLPICIGRTVSGGFGDQDIVLSGKFYGGRTKSYPVDMWKMVLRPGSEPRLLVKTTEGFWLRLLQPQPYYLKTFGDGYILAQFLHFVKERPSATAIELEKYLAKACSMYGQEPFLEKLTQHLRIIRSYVEEDGDLKSASVLRTVFPNIFTKNPSELRGDLSQHSRQVLRSVLGLNGERSLQNERKADNIRQDMMWGNGLTRGESSAERYVPGKAFVDEGINPKRSGGNLRFELAASEDKKLKRHAPKLERERHDSGKNDRKKTSWLVGGSRLHSEESNGARAKDDRKISQRSQTEMKKLDDPPICIMCDDGGDLLICDGPCNRYFHGFPGTGSESFCHTLALSRKETKGERWYCKNCELKQHQCFVCNKLGSTDAALGRPQIYMCEVPSCKRFYHAHCVAELVDFPNWRAKAEAIKNGTEPLICPRHRCDTCRYSESTPGILVQCRRCPKAWHRECFVNYSLSGEHQGNTIWKHDEHEFVYCRQHKINPTIMTPNRDHIRFPEVVDNTRIKKIKFKASGMSSTIERQYCETLPPNSLAAELGLFDQ